MPVERLETLHSTQNRHGVANLAANLEGPIPEHAYPGAARDRISVSATQDISGAANVDTNKIVSRVSSGGKRIHLTPPANMCVIRSGQDWANCKPKERSFYLNEVHPTLLDGMTYLTENAAQSRCLSMRLMTSVDQGQQELEQTFGLGYAMDIFAFEEWAKSHPTHLKIFGTFMTHAQKFGEQMQLRLWHEVTVLQDNDGEFEYLNCHQKTGLLPYC
jgi:aldoxime dehydratase